MIRMVYSHLFALAYTNSIIAIRAESLLRGGSLIILVYPPWREAYFGAISSNSFLTATLLFERRDAATLLEEILLSLPLVINFSTKGRTSLALASVVFILPFFIKARHSDLSRAFLWFLGRPNFRFLLWWRMVFSTNYEFCTKVRNESLIYPVFVLS